MNSVGTSTIIAAISFSVIGVEAVLLVHAKTQRGQSRKEDLTQELRNVSERKAFSIARSIAPRRGGRGVRPCECFRSKGAELACRSTWCATEKLRRSHSRHA